MGWHFSSVASPRSRATSPFLTPMDSHAATFARTCAVAVILDSGGIDMMPGRGLHL